MSLEYAQTRIKEALRLAKGNKTKARQQIIAWTYEDPKLLHELTKNHLTGIVAYHLERVAAGKAEPQKKAVPKAKKPAQKKKEDAFGMEILKAVASSDSQMFGFTEPGGSRRQVSQNHMNAIRQMAARAKSKKQ